MTRALLALCVLFSLVSTLFAPRLALAGGIAGQITDGRTGAPVEGAVVSAWSGIPDSTGAIPPDPGGEPPQGGGPSGGGGGVGTGLSDAGGNYLIEDLPAGEYFLNASAALFLGEFYPGTQNPEEATPIAVGETTVTGIDFSLDRGGCIHGRVTDQSTGQPIAGAFVSLGAPWMGNPTEPPLPPDGGTPPGHGGDDPPYPGFGVVTDGDGRYDLCGLYPGEYWVLASADGFLGEYYADARCLTDADPVPVAADEDVNGIDFALAVGGRITGRVLDGASPVAGAFVQAWNAAPGDSTVVPPDPNGGYPGWDCVGTWGASAVTDAAGAYVLTGLATGSYLVMAEAYDRPDLLPTFHGGGQDPQSATPVEVTAPETTPAIDIALERGGSVLGTVRDEETGEPLADIWVEIYLPIEGGPGPRRYLAAATDATGAYRIDGVPGGEQRVVASAWDRGYELEFYREAATPETATPIRIVPPADVSGIDFTLRRTQPGDGGIGGRVIAAEDEHPLPGAVVTAISLNGYAGVGLADSAGFYWISGLPADEYVVLAAAAGRLGVFYDQALSWEDATPVRVDGPRSEIDFALPATGGGRGVVSGRVTDASGRGVGQAGVYAEPERTSATGGFALSGADGRYTITGLESGRYRIRATRQGMNDAYAPGAPGGPPDWVTVAGQPVIDVLIVLGAGSPPPPGLRAEPSVPNPFRDQVAIRLTADRAGDPIVVDLYAVSGRHVRRLELETRSPGRQEVTWDGRDASGALVPSGLYVYRAEIAGQSVSGRLVLVR